MKNINDSNGFRTRDFPACSAMPQSTTLPRTPAPVESNCEYTYHIAPLTKTGESLPCIILHILEVECAIVCYLHSESLPKKTVYSSHGTFYSLDRLRLSVCGMVACNGPIDHVPDARRMTIGHR